MKSEARILPRLDQLYNQKKFYEVHKKKITQIKQSKSLSKRSLTLSKINDNQQDAKSIKSLIQQHDHQQELSICQNDFDFPLQKHMQTIPQVKPGLSYWLKKMNPHQKRLKQQQIKQNKRMRQKIKNSMPFIVQKNQLSDHTKNHAGIKKLISRFSVQQNSHKTKLKCEMVLKKINDLQKSKLKLQESRLLSYEKIQSTMEKRTIPTIDEKDRWSSFLPKRSKILSQKLNTINKQSVPIIKDHLIKRQNQTSLTRGKIQFQSKTNEMKTSNTFNKQIPTVGWNSLRYNRVKTGLIERDSTNRLANNSKLSDLSEDFARAKINLSEYKMMRLNFHNTESNNLKRAPSLRQTSFEKSPNKIMTLQNQTQLKKYVSNRIRTQNSSAPYLKNKNQESNKFDYKKKRIERYFISKRSLSEKEVVNKSLSQPRVGTQKKEERRVKIENEAIMQQKQEPRMATMQHQSECCQLRIIRNESKKKQQESPATYFATQIQE